jgi:hypothetical protein
MNTGQMLITVGAILLLSLVIMRVNTSFLTTNTIMSDSKYGLLGVSFASSKIEEAISKAFDKATIDNQIVTDSTLFTKSTLLGPESGEVYPYFDDFDDYDGYVDSTSADSTVKSDVFYISCKVDYVKTSNLDGISTTQTWHKKITVIVRSKTMEGTIKMSSVFSYWYFR